MKKRITRLASLCLSAGIIITQYPVTAHADIDYSLLYSIGYITCDDYVNLRAERGYDTEIIGYLWNGTAVQILDIDDLGWYQVYADGMVGYVACWFVTTSSSGSSYDSSYSYDTSYDSYSYDSSYSYDTSYSSSYTSYGKATVCTDYLNLRASASYDGAVIGGMSGGQTVDIVGYSGDWVQVMTADGCVGYVSCYYIGSEGSSYDCSSSYSSGSSYDYSSSASTDSGYSQSSSSSSYSGTDSATLYQIYLEKQAAADQACYGSDMQAVYDTAAAAQQAYQNYVAAVNAEEAAYYSGTSSSSYTSTDNSSSYEEVTYEEPQETYEEPSYSSLGQQIADFACQYVGCPYVWGGSSLSGGADCSGFTMAVYAQYGVSLPHNAEAQSGYGTAVSMDELQPGDLLFYYGSSGIGHVTMYIGNGQVVHASNPTNGIIISSIGYRTPCCARRYI